MSKNEVGRVVWDCMQSHNDNNDDSEGHVLVCEGHVRVMCLYVKVM